MLRLHAGALVELFGEHQCPDGRCELWLTAVSQHLVAYLRL